LRENVATHARVVASRSAHRNGLIALALRFAGRKRTHSADEIMAAIVARCLVEHLDRAGFVVMKKPPAVGARALGRGFERR
jgi:hypothetical protein